VGARGRGGGQRNARPHQALANRERQRSSSAALQHAGQRLVRTWEGDAVVVDAQASQRVLIGSDPAYHLQHADVESL
jgi:hypothetical protein